MSVPNSRFAPESGTKLHSVFAFGNGRVRPFPNKLLHQYSQNLTLCCDGNHGYMDCNYPLLLHVQSGNLSVAYFLNAKPVMLFCIVLSCAYPMIGICIDYELEPNDDVENATVIASGQAVQGNVGSVSDVDLFKFVSSSVGSARLFFRRTSRDYSYNIATIRVLDDQNTELSSVDAYAPDIYTTFDVGVVADQVYFIEISGCQGAGDCDDHRSEVYEFSIVQLPSPTFETEQNGTLGSADQITPNSWVFGQHAAKDDLDFYKIEIPSAGSLFAQVSRPSDNYQYSLGNVALVNSLGELLNSDDIYAPDGQGRVVLGIAQPGLYYLKLTSCSGGSRCDITFSNPYQVTVSFIPASPCDLIFQNGFEVCP